MLYLSFEVNLRLSAALDILNWCPWQEIALTKYESPNAILVIRVDYSVSNYNVVPPVRILFRFSV